MKEGELIFWSIALKPIERLLYRFRRVKGFRLLDHLFVTRVLVKKRVVFTHTFGKVKIALISNPNDDLFGISRSGELGRWEPESLRIWAEICSKSEAVIDVGAYSGIYSILAGKLGVKTVYSAEPNLNSQIRLRSNLRINNLSTKSVIGSPLDAESGVKIGLFVPETDQGVKVRSLESSGARYLASNNESVVIGSQTWSRIAIQETLKLDDVIDEKIKIGGLKIDAEGMELRVLMGSERILSLHKPQLIIETWSDSVTNELSSFLAKFGYSAGILIDDSTFNTSSKNLCFKHESA